MPPDAYRPEVVAQALVEVAVRPRAEVVLGGETVIMDLLNTYARPVAQRILLTIDRWYRSGDEPAPAPGALWRSPEHPRPHGGIPGRDSLLAPLQLGRRLLPSPSTPVRAVQHLTRAGKRAVDLRPALTRPVPEIRWHAGDVAQPRRTEAAVVSI